MRCCAGARRLSRPPETRLNRRRPAAASCRPAPELVVSLDRFGIMRPTKGIPFPKLPAEKHEEEGEKEDEKDDERDAGHGPGFAREAAQRSHQLYRIRGSTTA